MKKITYCLLAVLWPVVNVCAQDYEQIKRFLIGDPVPDVTINNIINYKFTSLNFSEFKDKLLILDFWNTGCGPCIASLPKMDSLQKKFGDQIQIIAVAPENEATVTRLLNTRWPGSMALSLPFVVSDTVLTGLFQYGPVPHEVWIKDGKILAVTNNDPVTAHNINEILHSRPVNMKMKLPFEFHPTDKPLLLNEKSLHAKNILYQSVITRWSEDVKGTGSGMLDLNDLSFRFYRYAFPVKKLFLAAFDPENKLNGSDNRVILENVKDSSRYIQPDRTDYSAFYNWRRKNLFNYELILPVPDGHSDKQKAAGRIQRIMQQDLNNFFGDLYGVEGSLQKRKLSCLVISLLPSFKPSSDTPALYMQGSAIHIWKGQPLKRIIKDIAWRSNRRNRGLSPVIVDETRFDGNANLKLDVRDLEDIGKLRKVLLENGLRITEETREMEVIVLHEKSQI